MRATKAVSPTTRLDAWFKRGKRRNGDTFTTLRDGAPKWLQEAIYEAHQGDMPDDWVYEECCAAVGAIDDGTIDLKEQDVHEHADSRVDIYTGELAQWYADHCGSRVFAEAEEEASDFDSEQIAHPVVDVNRTLTTIQYCAIARIASTIAQAVAEARDES